MRLYKVTVQQTYEVEASGVQDAEACVEAIYDRACSGRYPIRFDDDTTAELILTENVWVTPIEFTQREVDEAIQQQEIDMADPAYINDLRGFNDDPEYDDDPDGLGRRFNDDTED